MTIDLGKVYLKSDTVWIFLLDQFCHLITLIIAWSFFTDQLDSWVSWGTNLYADQKILVLIAGYLIVTLPTSKVILSLINKWSLQNDANQNLDESLKGGGKIIGILERVLIFTFVCLNQYEAIGFLLAAKSVFRFGDLTQAKDQRRTEYILIGTLLSFSLAIFIGIAVKKILS